MPQWGFSKGFDTYAPLGPCLVSTDLIKDPGQLKLKTIVDGEVRQEEMVSDMVFNCAYIVSYLSQGTTLQKGSVIMTGTPGGKIQNLRYYISLTVPIGVGSSLSPPSYLVPGTKMEVNISKIGTLKNDVEFA